MAFDQPTRNRLQKFVGDSRSLLTEEFTRQLQHEYGLNPTTGEVADLTKLTRLDDGRRQTARMLRETLEHYLATNPGSDRRATIERIVREQAFTVLNRLCALRMAEARGLLIESVGKGYQSKGFQLYARLAGTALGETGDAYRCYLFSLFDEFAVDLAVLFDRFSPSGRLFPREAALLPLLEQINHPDIDALWAEDETIGWIYQYFNSKDERKKMRDESAAPRNSRELAVRNQFFTPRYVVEFLTDNTLGRIWYEMTQGQTSLKDSCRYLVRRPNEIFLKEGEQPPSSSTSPLAPSGRGAGGEGQSQEDLLNQPVYIPFRPMKDPRDIKMLDPACGSMHFGLYAFDLFEKIYEEYFSGRLAVGSGQESPAASSSLPTADCPLPTDFPRLIIEHNIHGIDIDPRAVQIAGLSLWLRAQKSWQSQGVKPQARPQIRRSNIACAEPMPGEVAFLEEFIAQHLSGDPERQFLAGLVRKVFASMKLAGEAGSLLKIEEEIADEVAKAKRKWLERPAFKQRMLFAATPKLEQKELDLTSGITDASFWDDAEKLLYDALRAYSEQAEQGGGYQRRLFADDAARGFAFIDLCRKRYEVALMNPPFGAASKVWKLEFEKQYPRTKKDLYAAFVERGLHSLAHGGMVGAITSRTGFFLSSFQAWREELLLAASRPTVFADFGNGVLDAAMVETAAYCLGANPIDQTLFCRQLHETDKGASLLEDVQSLRRAGRSARVFIVRPTNLQKVPGSPFAYWVSDKIRDLFTTFKPFETKHRRACITNPAGDDARFFRSWVEIPSNAARGLIRWAPITRGGRYCPFFNEITQVIHWDDAAQTYRGFVGTVHRPMSKPASLEFFFKPGITWPLRGIRFSAHALPAGCIFSVAGKFATSDDEAELPVLLGLMNSNVFDFLIGFFAGKVGGVQYEVGLINKVPVPELPPDVRVAIASLALSGANARRSVERVHEASHSFQIPALLRVTGNSLNERLIEWGEVVAATDVAVSAILKQIDDIVFRLYAIGDEDQLAISTTVGTRELDSTEVDELDADTESDDCTDAEAPADGREKVAMLTSYLLGVVLARWDIRIATGKKNATDLPDPFAPLPICPPGMLQNEHGLPLTAEDQGRLQAAGCWQYPIDIPWNGLLLDDPGHPLDIEARVQQVLKIIWPDRCEAIEHEACEMLGVKTLREYFRKPALFFADHLKRYSKSRRQAPIYWPLATASGSYTLWVYYHRLTNETLYTSVNDCVEPKLKQVATDAARLRQKTGRTSADEKELEQLTDLEQELKDFRDELLRLAKFWKPNLNDGVQITAAPLWKLFRLSAWQKKLKQTWQELEAGDYDWAHLAYSIWLDRVAEKCKTDKSLAIAHNLEHLYVELPKPAKKRATKKKKVEAEIEDEEM